jgi:hypothetical protein
MIKAEWTNKDSLDLQSTCNQLATDTINRQAAIEALTENKEMINAVLDSLTLDYNTRRYQEQRRGQINEDIETIKELPSAQPERKKGKWIRESLVTNYPYKCSACIKYTRAMYDFCPNCGADMREETGGAK